MSNNLKVVQSKILYPETQEIKKGNQIDYKVLDTWVNLKWLMDHFGISVRYNMMRRNWDVSIPDGVVFNDDIENSVIRRVQYLATINMMPNLIKNIACHLDTIAEQDRFHPIVDVLRERPWDGVSRLDRFISTLKTQNPELSAKIIKTWMCSAVAAIHTPGGFTAHGVLVLQGRQKIGKTGWIKQLDPINCEAVKEGAHLDPTNKDDVSSVIRHWIVEIGELDSSFRKDIARLKSFITSSVDYIRAPYAIRAMKYPRQTVFAASVNSDEYLVDDTGNRRWWTVHVESVDFTHGLDIQQVWAEVYQIWKEGHPTDLSVEDQNLVNELNQEYEKTDPIEEKLLRHYDWSSLVTREMTTTEVMEEIGYVRPSRSEVTRCGSLLKELTMGDFRILRGIKKYKVPSFCPHGYE